VGKSETDRTLQWQGVGVAVGWDEDNNDEKRKKNCKQGGAIRKL
jgi:hypothetical protein